ncbi:chitobiase/beta-hexosaminidase C-terminal domain-containing protein [bacterium]|nr:chitobiase/beta-hexosaminidase C-terminal domain-containing protein [bacterium]RQV93321.1 MAG: T9SS C-terminal target domain-containing protein [bacterium]
MRTYSFLSILLFIYPTILRPSEEFPQPINEPYKTNDVVVADFQVNSDSRSRYPSLPHVGTDGSGHFIIVWSDDCTGDKNIYCQAYTNDGSALGGNFRVNDDTGSGEQNAPVIAVNHSGNFVIVWVDERSATPHLYGQRYSSGGAALGVNFKVNTAGWIQDPSIAMDSNGNFIIAWTDWRNGNADIYFQHYNSNGSPVGMNTRVNTDTESAWQGNAAVAIDGNGNFVIAWADTRNGSSDYDIYCQRYNSSGAPLWGNFPVNDDTGIHLSHWPAVAYDDEGNFIITWTDNRIYQNANDIYFRRYDNNGSALSNNIIVNDDGTGFNQMYPSIAFTGDGYFVIAWEDKRSGASDSEKDIYGQVYDVKGTACGNNFKINTDTEKNIQTLPDIGLYGTLLISTWKDDRISAIPWSIFANIINLTSSMSADTVATPEFDPLPGVFNESLDVTISCSTSGAIIHYTMDGSEPSDLDATYAGSIHISSTTILKARAYKEDLTPSEVFTGTYTIIEETVPLDFQVSATAGGMLPIDESINILIIHNGEGHYSRYISGGDPIEPLEESAFTLTGEALEQIWQSVQENDFFNLNNCYADTNIFDRTFAHLIVWANGSGHDVSTMNMAVPAFDAIMDTINSVIPYAYVLKYDTTTPPPFVSRDICNAGGIPKRDNLLQLRKMDRTTEKIHSCADNPVQESHPGTCVGHRMSLQDAVNQGIVTLTGKGNHFWGDQVSLTGNNASSISTNTVTVKLYLEFWGPEANEATVQRVINGIKNKWDGKTTAGGKHFEVEVVTRLNKNATSPPGTAGYHQIKLENREHSYVAGMHTRFRVNQGVGSGSWGVSGDDIEHIYGHEAGHLMGLEDEYTMFLKADDGDWYIHSPRNLDINGLSITAEQLAQNLYNLYHTNSVAYYLEHLENNKNIALPHATEMNQVMGNPIKPPHQQDIDNIATQAGILIEVVPGSILANKNGNDQNFTTTRSVDLFVPAGETKTIQGLYVACIDSDDGIPLTGQQFDLAPSLQDWSGVESASLLSKLLQYIDEQEIFCSSDYYSQLAIWRITDNECIGMDGVDNLLESAGIAIWDQILYFPRMSNPNSSTPGTGSSIPPELFVADISPPSTLTDIGTHVVLAGSLHAPSLEGYTVGHSWSLETPQGSAVQLSNTEEDSIAFTTDVRGFFIARLVVNLDSGFEDTRTFNAIPNGIVVAADSRTETFERGSLLGGSAFSWETSGNAPWTITNDFSHSGSCSVQSGEISDNQSTILSVTVSNLEAGQLQFAYCVSTEKEFDELLFYIDGILQDTWSGKSFWHTVQYELGAGVHTLSWIYQKDEQYEGGSDCVWLDDIFFPESTVLTSISLEENSEIPNVYDLLQNYPNPFNPITTITFSLPEAEKVSIKVYDTLGREVAILIDDLKSAGRHQVTFTANDFPSGIYFYQMESDHFKKRMKMVVLK